MKRTSTILCSAALAILSASLIAESPAPAAPEPAKQQALESMPERRAEAEAAINASVLAILRAPTEADELANRFSRRIQPMRSMNQYTLAYTDAAPAGVVSNGGRQPFEVRQPALSPKGEERVFLAGYYDGNSKSVQLYNASAKAYVVAAEHPFIKARVAKK